MPVPCSCSDCGTAREADPKSASDSFWHITCFRQHRSERRIAPVGGLHVPARRSHELRYHTNFAVFRDSCRPERTDESPIDRSQFQLKGIHGYATDTVFASAEYVSLLFPRGPRFGKTGLVPINPASSRSGTGSSSARSMSAPRCPWRARCSLASPSRYRVPAPARVPRLLDAITTTDCLGVK